MNVDTLRTCIQFLAVCIVLLFSPLGNAQMMMERPRHDPKLYAQPNATQPKAAEKSPAVGVVERRRLDPALAVRPLPIEPCDLVTRDEFEAILKRSDTDRALVNIPGGGGAWQPDRKQVQCRYGVNYERKIFPDQIYDNLISITIDFDDKYAKQGQLYPDRPVIFGYQMALDVVSGLGDEAVFLTDVSRARQDEKYRGTAGVNRSPIYDNRDYLLVRYKTILFKFEIASTVAGNTGSGYYIQIARRALARLKQAEGA